MEALHSSRIGWISLGISILLIVSVMIASPSQVLAKGSNSSPFTVSIERYVAPTGQDGGDCTSPSSPCRTIQYAVNKSYSGDTILVATGTYFYDQTQDKCQFLITRAVVCFVDKSLTIKGGYSSSNWQQDPLNNKSIIDGQSKYRGVATIAYNNIASLSMEGFIIQNGRSIGIPTDLWSASGRGGGIWAQGARVDLKQMVFKNNIAKGADNTTLGGDATGGALMIESVLNQSKSILRDIVFQDNQSLGGNGAPRGGLALGGALFVYKSQIEGEKLVFYDNIAQAGSTSGDGEVNSQRQDALGGAISLQQDSNGIFKELEAYRNQAIGGDARGAGGGAFGGAIMAEDSALLLLNAVLRQNIVQGGKGNIGGYAMGGGLITDDSSLSFDRGIIAQNRAVSGETLGNNTPTGAGGGGVYLTAFTRPNQFILNLSNILITDNTLGIEGDNIKKGGSGAGMVVQALTANINHATLANNQVKNDARFGQAIMVVGLRAGDNTGAILNLHNSIVSDHIHPFTSSTSAVTVVSGSTLNLKRVLFSNNTNNINTNSEPVPPGQITGLESTIQAESAGFTSPGAPGYDYHLSSESSAIDKAYPTDIHVDFEGENRPYNGFNDIGADEYTPLMLKTIPEEVLGITNPQKPIVLSVTILTNRYTNARWVAQTSIPWITFDSSANSSMQSGNVDEKLSIHVLPEQLSEGWHEGEIIITCDQTDPLTLKVRVLITENLSQVYLPIIIKTP